MTTATIASPGRRYKTDYLATATMVAEVSVAELAIKEMGVRIVTTKNCVFELTPIEGAPVFYKWYYPTTQNKLCRRMELARDVEGEDPAIYHTTMDVIRVGGFLDLLTDGLLEGPHTVAEITTFRLSPTK